MGGGDLNTLEDGLKLINPHKSLCRDLRQSLIELLALKQYA